MPKIKFDLLFFQAYLFAIALGFVCAPSYRQKRHPIATTIPVLVAEQRGERDILLPVANTIVEITHYLEKAIEIKLEIRPYPWKRVLKNGEHGEGLIFGIYRTPEREQLFNFSAPVYSDKVWLMTRCENSFSFNDINDLHGKTIGIVEGSSAGEEFDRQVNRLFKAEYNTSSLAGRFSKLYLKRMDAFLLYEPRINIKEIQKEFNRTYAAHIENYSIRKNDIFCILPKPVSTIDVHFAISKASDSQILEKIDRALERAKKSGEIEKIFSK